jgi:hypothetical protein
MLVRRVPSIVLGVALLVAPAASYAIAVPLPTSDFTLNLDLQLQPQFLVTEAGTPDGTTPRHDLFLRRARVSVGGNVDKSFSYFFQLDNANFGKFGNSTGRVAVQDAWVGWAPTGIDGGTVVYIDAGLLYIPISRHYLVSTTNFVTADVQMDAFRFPNNNFLAFRDLGVQVRGWALDKRIGFRAGVHEGYTPEAQPAGSCATGGAGCITPRQNPAFGGLVNVDVIGSEEGSWLYSTYRWGTSPVLSVSGAFNYQSLALRNGFGSLTDQKLFTTGLYLDLPGSERSELVVDATLYLNRNGSGSPNTGTGFAGAVGYRYGFIAPYVAYDYFESSGCDASNVTPADLAACNANVDSANSRNFKAGVNLFFNKNLNHLNIEFGINHGLSAFGPSSITTGTAGYVPASLDPLVPGGPRRAFTNSLANPAFKSLAVQWTIYL